MLANGRSTRIVKIGHVIVLLNRGFEEHCSNDRDARIWVQWPRIAGGICLRLNNKTLFKTHADALRVLPVLQRIAFEREEAGLVAIVESTDLALRKN
jgi:hypothetical protein